MLQESFFSLSPVWHNALVTVLSFVYVFSVPPILDYLVSNHGLPRDISRKITHICAGSVIVFLPLFVDTDWSCYLNVSVFVVWAVLFFLKGLFAAEDDQAVKTMTRTGDRRELLRGTLYFVLVGIVCGTLYYKTFEGVLAMAVLGWGDGWAPIIGTRLGKMKYRVFSDKSVEGSLAFFAGSVTAALFFVWLIVPESFELGKILLVVLLATIVEGMSPKEFDNLIVPAAVIVASQLL